MDKNKYAHPKAAFKILQKLINVITNGVNFRICDSKFAPPGHNFSAFKRRGL